MTDTPDPAEPVRTVDPADLAGQPWRNGAGSTRVVGEQPGPAGALGWRLSLADLDRPATFSSYPGVDRCSSVVTGAGLDLLVDGVATAAAPLEVVRYAGEADVRAELVDGPVVNLNLMVTRRRGSGDLHVRRVNGRVSWRPPTVAVVLVEGGLDLGGRPHGHLETVLVDGREVALVAHDAVVVEVSVSREVS